MLAARGSSARCPPGSQPSWTPHGSRLTWPPSAKRRWTISSAAAASAAARAPIEQPARRRGRRLGRAWPRWAGPACWRPSRPAASRLDLAGAAEILRAAGEHVAPEPLLAVAGLSALLLARLGQRRPRMPCSLNWSRAAACPRWPGRKAPATSATVPLDLRLRSTARATGGVLLQGEKLMVLPGAAASGWLVSARGEDDTVLLWVPRGTAGVTETLVPLVDGEPGLATCASTAWRCPPAPCWPKARPPGMRCAMTLAAGQILQSAELLGTGQAMLGADAGLPAHALAVRQAHRQLPGAAASLLSTCSSTSKWRSATLDEVLALAATGRLCRSSGSKPRPAASTRAAPPPRCRRRAQRCSCMAPSATRRSAT